MTLLKNIPLTHLNPLTTLFVDDMVEIIHPITKNAVLATQYSDADNNLYFTTESHVIDEGAIYEVRWANDLIPVSNSNETIGMYITDPQYKLSNNKKINAYFNKNKKNLY